MTRVAHRTAIGCLAALLLPLSSATVALAEPVPVLPPPVPPVSSGAPVLDPAPAAATKRVPRWRDYIGQKIIWSAKRCNAADITARDAVSTPTKPLKIECANLITALSWSDLGKGAIALHVVRAPRATPPDTRKATRPPAARGLFINPGGPGVAAGPVVSLLAVATPTLRATHDIVGVDPRGTGGSTPLPCPAVEDGVADYRVTTAKVRAAVQASMRTWVRRCTAAHGRYLPHITTVNTVHDQDLVRRLLGYPEADWYGASGGTWMGAWYAQLHPTTVGRFVLDANTRFTADWRTSFATMPMAMQRRFDQQFLPWTARHHARYGLGTKARSVGLAYEQLRSAAGRGRVRGVTPNALDAVTGLMLYDDATFEVLATALSAAVRQLRADPEGTVRFPLPEDLLPDWLFPASFETVRRAVICNDTRFTRTPASFEREILAAGRKYPLWGYSFQQAVAPCAYWPYRAQAAPRIDGKGVPTMLMVQTELDPATPIEGARQAHAENRATRLLTVDDDGNHGAFPGNPCVDRVVLRFLREGRLPAKDLPCAGLPLPGDTKTYPVTTG